MVCVFQCTELFGCFNGISGLGCFMLLCNLLCYTGLDDFECFNISVSMWFVYLSELDCSRVSMDLVVLVFQYTRGIGCFYRYVVLGVSGHWMLRCISMDFVNLGPSTCCFGCFNF